MSKPDQKAIVVVGISGPSSSGKTTLARLLRDIVPNSFVLHQDDFFKPENEYLSLSFPTFLFSAVDSNFNAD